MALALGEVSSRRSLAERLQVLRGPLGLALVGLAGYVLFGCATLVMGRLTGDEGWYTFAAQSVVRGQLPHRHFAFTQPPLMPLIYAPWLALTGPSVLSARVLSFVLGGAACMLGMLAAQRRAGPVAAAIMVALVAGNASVMFDLCSVKTQPLTVALSALLLFALAHEPARWATPLACVAASALLATRLSTLPVLGIVGWYTLRGPQPRAALLWLAGCALALAGLVWLCDPRRLWFGVVVFHDAWYGYPKWEWSEVPRTTAIMIVRNQWPLLLAAAVALAARKWVPRLEHARFSGMCCVCWLATTAIHVSRPFSVAAYQTSNVLFLALPVACVLAQLYAALPRVRRGGTLVLALCVALGWRTQEYVATTNGDGGLARLRDAAEAIQPLATNDTVLWTLSTELAVETRLPLLPGWNLGEFSWFARTSDDDLARAFGVYNEAMLLRDLTARRAGIVCLTRRHMSMLGMRVMTTLREHYRFAGSVERYGQFFEPLHVFVRRSDP